MMSAPIARSLTALVKLLTTLKLTSASSSARRISRIAAEMSSSVRVPRPRTSARVAWSFSERESNIAQGRRLLIRPTRVGVRRGHDLMAAARRCLAPGAQRLADATEGLGELGRDHEYFVGIALGQLGQHLQ